MGLRIEIVEMEEYPCPFVGNCAQVGEGDRGGGGGHLMGCGGHWIVRAK